MFFYKKINILSDDFYLSVRYGIPTIFMNSFEKGRMMLRTFINRLILFILIIAPSSLHALEDSDVISHIGYDFMEVMPGNLEIDYRLDIYVDKYDFIINAFNTEHVKYYAITNAFFLSYDVAGPVSLNCLIPYVYAYSDQGSENSITVSDMGDISLGAKAQLYQSAKTALNFNLKYILSTGKSPYKVNSGELSTGSGYDSIQTRLTLVKKHKPVYPYFGVHYYNNLKINDFNNLRYGSELDSLDPGKVVGIDLGLGIAASENFSLQFGIEYDYYHGAEYHYKAGTTPVMDYSTKDITIGCGWKITDKTALHLTFLRGIDDDSTDYQVHLYIPTVF